MRVAQRYGCPAMGGVVKGRKSTVESVQVEEHRGAALGLRGRALSGRLVTGVYICRNPTQQPVPGGSVLLRAPGARTYLI